MLSQYHGFVMSLFRRTAVIVIVLCAGVVQAADLELVWQTGAVFQTPESVVYDAKRNQLYVSNIQGEVNTADQKGFISVVSLDGQVMESEWVAGLDAPKGLALVDDRLYVADINQLVVIDVEQAKVIQRYVAETAQFLNDVTADQAGTVYVSDMQSNRIYRMAGERFEIWLEDAALDNPNGVLAEDNRLVVGSWGRMTDGMKTEVPGHLKQVSLSDRVLSDLTDASPIGNLDGVESDGAGGYWLTDWFKGALIHVDQDGKANETMLIKQGTADHTVILEKKLLLIPMMQDNALRAYRLP